jgi:hypothetical protein
VAAQLAAAGAEWAAAAVEAAALGRAVPVQAVLARAGAALEASAQAAPERMG